MGAKIIGVRCLFFLVLCNELFLLGRVHSCYEGCGRVRARIRWGHVHPSRVADDYPILFLGYHAGEEAVALPVNKMGAFYNGECPPEFILEGINGFGCDDARDLCDGVLLGSEHFVRSVFGQFG